MQSGHSKRDLISKAKSSQFVVVIVASVIVSASLIGINMLWDQRSYQSEIISAKTDARNQLLANIDAVEQLEIEFAKLEQSPINSSIVLDALPSKYDFPALASSVEKLATISEVRLESFVGDDQSATSENSAGQPQPVEMEFSVSINGTYDEIKKFAANLQRSIRPFRIVEASFQSSGENRIQSNMRIITYYMPAKSLEIRKQSISSQPAAAGTTTPAGGVPAPAAGAADLPPGVDASGVPQ